MKFHDISIGKQVVNSGKTYGQTVRPSK